MPNAARSTVYNLRIVTPGMLVPSPRFPRAAGLLLLAFMVLLAPRALGAEWAAPALQLAGKIAAATGPGAVALEITNRSSLARPEAEEIGRILRVQLASSGLQFVSADQAAASVRVWLSEDLQSYIWIAEIHLGAGQSSVAMVSLPRVATGSPRRESAAMAIHKTLLWSQADRVLDLLLLNHNPTQMLVLDANQVALYQEQNNRWQLEQSMPVAHVRPWPRDLRGRLVLRQDYLFDAYLPGVLCHSSGKVPLSLHCSESDDPWPLGTDQFSLSGFFTPSRNYFTGALAPGIGKQTTAPAFYAAAPLPRDKYTLWLVAGVDGRIHLLDGVTDQVLDKLDWGSDVTSVHSGCGTGWDVLATASGDAAPDTVRAYDFPDRDALAVSPPLTFDGPVTALWEEANGSDAIAISQNLETGAYEVCRLTITCGQ
jgi:hypothetical protein